MKVLARFKSAALSILIATDVASRGLHIEGVTHVINYDLPQDAQDYVHRIGRTARAGASGKAISLACEDYVLSLSDIEEYIKQKIPVHPVTDELIVTGYKSAHAAYRPKDLPQRRKGRPDRRLKRGVPEGPSGTAPKGERPSGHRRKKRKPQSSA